MIDVNAFIGPYPFRAVPHPEPEVLVRVLDREKIDRAWVGHLPSAFHRDPTAGNAQLFAELKPHAGRLKAVPAIRPDWPRWEQSLQAARESGATAVRAYPPQWQLGPHDASMAELAIACGEAKLPLVLTVKFEDLRQRHPLDVAGDLSAAAIRSLARAGSGVRLVVTAASRDLIEEVHWGLTPAEQERVLWDISWIWGPPEDHLAKLSARSARSDSCTAHNGRCGSRKRRAPTSISFRTISAARGSAIPSSSESQGAQAIPPRPPPPPARPPAGAATTVSRGQALSAASRSGNRQPGSSFTRTILRGPKFSAALKVLLPPNHTSTGQVTIAVALSIIRLLVIGLMAGPFGANWTLSTTGDGICPSCRTVTVVLPPAVVIPVIEPSTASVVKSQ